MGEVEILREVDSPPEGIARTVRIYRPASYEQEPDERFGVIYMQDGQNVLEHPESACHPTWAADLALERELRTRRIGPWMIVAVDHGPGRFEDYSPWDEPRAQVSARGERYASFLIDHLKPFVDRAYRTRPEPGWTAVMGSSLGGLISLYLGWRHSDVFGRIGALSPSVMWCEGELFHRWSRRGEARVYLDAGERERFETDAMVMDYGSAVRAFGEHLRSLGYGPEQLRCVLEPGGLHGEADWRRRLPAALRWLLSDHPAHPF